MKLNLKERKKQAKGITLIALVITIIVLLILAGVTIATLTGENGILTKAQNAKKVMSDAEIEEKIKLAVIASKINVNNTVDTATLTSELNNQFGENGWTKTEIDAYTWKVAVNGKSYKIYLTTGAIEKVTGIIVSASPSKVLAGQTATITLALDGIDKTGDISFTANPSSAATISNINQTSEGATATVTIAEEATESIKIEGKLDEDNKAECTITVILDVTNVAVDSNLSKVETGSTLNIANCITNKDSIEEFTITAVTVGNATKENDTTIKGTADGTATVTITGTKSGKTKDITVTVTKPEVLEVGSYVKYGVTYTDMRSSATVYDNTTKEKCGWRILDLGTPNSNGTYGTTENPVKLISTGIPANLYYHYNTNTTNNWWDITQTSGSAYKAASGLQNNFKLIPFAKITSGDNGANNGYYYNDITNSDQSTEDNASKGAIFLTTKASKVSNLTLAELNRARYEDTDHDNETSTSVSSKDKNGLFNLRYTYWLASAVTVTA